MKLRHIIMEFTNIAQVCVLFFIANQISSKKDLFFFCRFLLDLSKINEFAERTACFMFQATFAEELEAIHGRNCMLHSTIEVSLSIVAVL